MGIKAISATTAYRAVVLLPQTGELSDAAREAYDSLGLFLLRLL